MNLTVLKKKLAIAMKQDDEFINMKSISVPLFEKMETVLSNEQNQRRIYAIIKKKPQGLRIVEIEREMSVPLLDNDFNIKDWHFDQESHRLVLQYVTEKGKECVKVFPLRSINRH